MRVLPSLKDESITNENIYFENYYDEQRKFERII
jgi:hypothetical protein